MMAAQRGRPIYPSLRNRLILTVALCAILALVARSIIGERGLFEVWRKKGSYHRLAADVQAFREENVSLNREIQALRASPFAIERIAREELGYARPGEITFVFREDGGPRIATSP